MVLQRKPIPAKAEVLFQGHIRPGKFLRDIQEKKPEHLFQKAQSWSSIVESAGHPVRQALGIRLKRVNYQ